MFKLDLGDKVRCRITGFEGIVTGRAQYYNNCLQYCLKPPIDKDGKHLEGIWIDEQQLEIVTKGAVKPSWMDQPLKLVGGPQADQAPVG